MEPNCSNQNEISGRESCEISVKLPFTTIIEEYDDVHVYKNTYTNSIVEIQQIGYDNYVNKASPHIATNSDNNIAINSNTRVKKFPLEIRVDTSSSTDVANVTDIEYESDDSDNSKSSHRSKKKAHKRKAKLVKTKFKNFIKIMFFKCCESFIPAVATVITTVVAAILIALLV
jgi:hypothetical protein